MRKKREEIEKEREEREESAREREHIVPCVLSALKPALQKPRNLTRFLLVGFEGRARDELWLPHLLQTK